MKRHTTDTRIGRTGTFPFWIGNDEGLYRLAMELNRRYKNATVAAHVFIREVGTTRTPDGAKWSVSAVRAALVGLKE